MGNATPCRSEHARDECPDTAGIQTASVIVGDHREHARSYKDKPMQQQWRPCSRPVINGMLLGIQHGTMLADLAVNRALDNIVPQG
jgi:hypothetical protein